MEEKFIEVVNPRLSLKAAYYHSSKAATLVAVVIVSM